MREKQFRYTNAIQCTFHWHMFELVRIVGVCRIGGGAVMKREVAGRATRHPAKHAIAQAKCYQWRNFHFVQSGRCHDNAIAVRGRQWRNARNRDHCHTALPGNRLIYKYIDIAIHENCAAIMYRIFCEWSHKTALFICIWTAEVGAKVIVTRMILLFFFLVICKKDNTRWPDDFSCSI